MSEFNRKHPMKTYIRYTLIAVLTLGLGAGKLSAGDDEAWAAIGGFVAGVITGTIIDNDHHYHVEHRGRYEPRRDHGRPPPPAYRDHGYRYPHERHGHPTRYGGHWELRKVRIWVPGYWEFTYNRHGTRIRVWKPGHYAWQKNRVWVPHTRKGKPRHYCD